MSESSITENSGVKLTTKSKSLSSIIIILVAVLATYWFLYPLQFIGFLLLGVGGYMISGFIRLSLVPLWQYLIALVLIILGAIGWKKIPSPGWVQIFASFTLIIGFLPSQIILIPFAEYLVEALGNILAVITLYKVNTSYKREFGKIKFREYFLHLILVFAITTAIIIGLFIFIFWIQSRQVKNDIKRSLEIQNILNTPSDQLNPEQLSIKKSSLDRDLDIRMRNLHSFVFEPYFKVTRASDGHRTYAGMCNSKPAISMMEILREDSPQEPVCRDSDKQAIIYASNNQGIILCVDVNNINPVILSDPPTGLTCK